MSVINTNSTVIGEVIKVVHWCQWTLFTAEPPVCCWLIWSCAAEVWIKWYRALSIEPKVILAKNTSLIWFKATSGWKTIDMQSIYAIYLPKLSTCWNTNVTTDIYVINFLAHTKANKIEDVEITKVATKIIPAIVVWTQKEIGRLSKSAS